MKPGVLSIPARIDVEYEIASQRVLPEKRVGVTVRAKRITLATEPARP